MEKLRAWWFYRQGLTGVGSIHEVFDRSGWARSVGGSNAYLTLFSRAGKGKLAAESAVKNMEFYELPSARGCTHFVPRNEFALALKVGGQFGSSSDFKRSSQMFGVTNDEVERLCSRVVDACSEPLDPKAIKAQVGDAIREFGPDGKKIGMSSTLSLALGRLQQRGDLVRVPVDGRLDTQRFAYRAWSPNPLEGFRLGDGEANTELARRYFKWIGPATLAHFRWFSGLGVAAGKAAIEPLALAPTPGHDGYLMLPEDLAEYASFALPEAPQIALISSIDSLLLHRRDVTSLLNESDRSRNVPGEKGFYEVGGVQDLAANAIVDRGRIIGLWQFDADAGKIASMLFVPRTDAIQEAIAKTEELGRELGDIKSFSLDSMKSRRAQIDALRAA